MIIMQSNVQGSLYINNEQVEKVERILDERDLNNRFKIRLVKRYKFSSTSLYGVEAWALHKLDMNI